MVRGVMARRRPPSLIGALAAALVAAAALAAALAVWSLGLVSVVVAARRRLEDVGDGWRALLLGAPPAVA
jgi:hypothetical protein